jgi:hypothetical protein
LTHIVWRSKLRHVDTVFMGGRHKAGHDDLYFSGAWPREAPSRP